MGQPLWHVYIQICKSMEKCPEMRFSSLHNQRSCLHSGRKKNRYLREFVLEMLINVVMDVQKLCHTVFGHYRWMQNKRRCLFSCFAQGSAHPQKLHKYSHKGGRKDGCTLMLRRYIHGSLILWMNTEVRWRQFYINEQFAAIVINIVLTPE